MERETESARQMGVSVEGLGRAQQWERVKQEAGHGSGQEAFTPIYFLRRTMHRELGMSDWVGEERSAWKEREN